MKTKKYIRDKKGQPVGVLVAAENEKNFAIGFPYVQNQGEIVLIRNQDHERNH